MNITTMLRMENLRLKLSEKRTDKSIVSSEEYKELLTYWTEYMNEVKAHGKDDNHGQASA